MGFQIKLTFMPALDRTCVYLCEHVGEGVVGCVGGYNIHLMSVWVCFSVSVLECV